MVPILPRRRLLTMVTNMGTMLTMVTNMGTMLTMVTNMGTMLTTNRPARPVSINWREGHPIHHQKHLQRGRKTDPRASKLARNSLSKAARTTRNRAILSRGASSTTATRRASP